MFIRSSRCTNSSISNWTWDFIFNKVHFVELTLPPLHSRLWRNISAVNIQKSYLKLEPIRVMQHSIRVVLYLSCGFLKPSSWNIKSVDVWKGWRYSVLCSWIILNLMYLTSKKHRLFSIASHHHRHKKIFTFSSLPIPTSKFL